MGKNIISPILLIVLLIAPVSAHAGVPLETVKGHVGPQFYTLAHWHEVITQIQDVATKRTRLGIPVLYGIDAVHGANYTQGATLFPQGFAVAATWDPEVARRIGEITAYEVRASGIPWNFHPVLDLAPAPLAALLGDLRGRRHACSHIGQRLYGRADGE